MAFLHTDKPVSVTLNRDEDGYREYKVAWIVFAQVNEGAFDVLNCPGLPLPGSAWTFHGSPDPWVWCRPQTSVRVRADRGGDSPRADKPLPYDVEQTFSNKPEKRCHELSIEDPVLQPPKISGSYVQYQEEATLDMFGRPIVSSSWEQIRGQQVEFDANRPTVEIDMNVSIFSLPDLASRLDTLNDAVLWGLLPRMIKFSRLQWQRLVYGLCYVYYNLRLGFDVNYKTFDRIVPDEGQKVITGHWHPTQDVYLIDNIGGLPADPMNPAHFMRAVDRTGNPITIPLDGYGRPAGTKVNYTAFASGLDPFCTEIGNVLVMKYPESNFLQMGIPSTF